MELPAYIETALVRLNEKGFEAFVVGGCVRDALLGLTPKDYDICTAALPEETESCFFEYPKILNGKKHGTVGVIFPDGVAEITAYRSEEGYADGRHPDSVRFVKSIETDLSRRDFTVNAMAYNRERGLVDPFGGREDLRLGRISTVGVPEKRFREDGLRILRGLRFASRLDFSIEENTGAAMRENRELLRGISAERLFSELKGILLGKGVQRVLLGFPEPLCEALPELKPMIGFDQKSRYHCYDLYEHTARVVGATPGDTVLRLAALLHDIGKPAAFFIGPDGFGHFYGHGGISARMAERALLRLRCDNDTKKQVVFLVKEHDRLLPKSEKGMRKLLFDRGEKNIRQLLLLQRADAEAHAPWAREQRLKELQVGEALLDAVLSKHPCLSLKELAVTGGDLLAAGAEAGPALGKALNRLLELVIAGDVPNEKEALLKLYKERLKEE